MQEILGEPQVKISKHLNYLKARRMVEVHSEANWRIYRLPAKRSPELAANLACLRECLEGDRLIKRDNLRLATVRECGETKEKALPTTPVEVPSKPAPRKRQFLKNKPLPVKQPTISPLASREDSFLIIPQRSFPL
jgi:DNA-binding transcriptional ArsR family regulator